MSMNNEISRNGAINAEMNQLERLLQLLADRAIQGLKPDQEQELQQLLSKFSDLDEDALDLTAAAIELAFAMPQESLPQHVRDAITQQTSAYFSKQTITQTSIAEPSAQANTELNLAEDNGNGIVAIPSKRRSRLRKAEDSSWLNWLIAGACLLLAILGWWPRLFPATPDDLKNPLQLREEFMASAQDIIVMQWQTNSADTDDKISGDVVWSNASQRGFVMLQNLRVNNPTEQQYQLWIIDQARDEKYPVNAGIFDVAKDSDATVIAFEPLLPITQATRFKITAEPRGGVVWSEAEPLLATTATE